MIYYMLRECLIKQNNVFLQIILIILKKIMDFLLRFIIHKILSNFILIIKKKLFSIIFKIILILIILINKKS